MAEGVHRWSSYQLLASRLLGWGLSGPLSCFVAKGAQVPSWRRAHTQLLVLVCRSAGDGPGAPTGLPPTSSSKLGSKMTQGRVQSCPHLLCCPASFLFEGRLRPPQIPAGVTTLLRPSIAPAFAPGIYPSSPRVPPNTHPTPKDHPLALGQALLSQEPRCGAVL